MQQQYFLTLQLQKGKKVYIDIASLTIAQNFKPISLEDIDAFTISFTKEEILKAIAEANIADGYLEGNLCIICLEDKKEHVLPVLTKDIGGNFKIEQYLSNNINNKNLMNDFRNKFNNVVLDELSKQQLKAAFKELNLTRIYELFYQLPYINRRELIFYLINNLEKENKKYPELKLDKNV